MPDFLDEREKHKAVLGAEKADDPTAIKVYRAVARNYRQGGRGMGVASSIDAICDRLEASNARVRELESLLSAAVDVMTPVDQASGCFFAATGKLCPFSGHAALELDGPFNTDVEAAEVVRKLLARKVESNDVPPYIS